MPRKSSKYDKVNEWWVELWRRYDGEKDKMIRDMFKNAFSVKKSNKVDKEKKMKCKECKKEVTIEIREATISIRDATKNVAIEIVADDICLDCLLKALKVD